MNRLISCGFIALENSFNNEMLRFDPLASRSHMCDNGLAVSSTFHAHWDEHLSLIHRGVFGVFMNQFKSSGFIALKHLFDNEMLHFFPFASRCIHV